MSYDSALNDLSFSDRRVSFGEGGGGGGGKRIVKHSSQPPGLDARLVQSPNFPTLEALPGYSC